VRRRRPGSHSKPLCQSKNGLRLPSQAVSVEARGIEPRSGKAKLPKQQGDTATAPAEFTHPFAHELQNLPEPMARPRPPTPSAIPSTDPNLARIVAAWPALPEAIRRAMLALVESGQH
jgi:hypothetical protein